VRRRSDRPYDAAAATFDRHCKLPEGVAQAIRGGVLRALDLMRPRLKAKLPPRRMKTRSVLLFIVVIAAIPIGARGSDINKSKETNSRGHLFTRRIGSLRGIP
jgi:hypothetical protein